MDRFRGTVELQTGEAPHLIIYGNVAPGVKIHCGEKCVEIFGSIADDCEITASKIISHVDASSSLRP